ncbi:hypothetical protein D3C76_1676950 [compost metagenome]
MSLRRMTISAKLRNERPVSGENWLIASLKADKATANSSSREGSMYRLQKRLVTLAT